MSAELTHDHGRHPGHGARYLFSRCAANTGATVSSCFYARSRIQTQSRLFWVWMLTRSMMLLWRLTQVAMRPCSLTPNLRSRHTWCGIRNNRRIMRSTARAERLVVAHTSRATAGCVEAATWARLRVVAGVAPRPFADCACPAAYQPFHTAPTAWARTDGCF